MGNFFDKNQECKKEDNVEQKYNNNFQKNIWKKYNDNAQKNKKQKYNNNFQKEECNVLATYTEKNKKILLYIIIMIIILIVLLIPTIKNIVNAQENIKRSEQFVAQLIQEREKLQEAAKIIKAKKIQIAKTPKLTEEGKENIKHIYRSDTKRAFLTFDDGPSNNTVKILDILKENGIKATFFMVGSQVEVFPETTKRVYDEGHYIANHGYSHVYSQIYQFPETVLNEFNQCNDVVKKTIGNDEYNSHLFRFPGGSVRRKICRNKKSS